MASRGGRRRARGQDLSQPAGWMRRGRGQWVAGSVVYGSVTLISDVRGDVSLGSGERPLYWIGHFGLNRPSLSVLQARERPSRLLQVSYEIVDFACRTPQLDQLRVWRDGTETVLVLLIHGTGGQGKSRLVLHFARDSAEWGWRTLTGRHANDPISVVAHPAELGSPEGAGGQATDATPGIMMVVDYAERWPLTDLLELITDAARQGGSKVRILLLARPAGTWWQTVSYRIDQMSFPAVSVSLPPLGTQVDPQILFDMSCRQFAEALQVKDTAGFNVPTGLGHGTDPGLVLGVHMAALATVDARRSGLAPPNDQAGVSSYLLKRERDHWQRLHDQGQIRIGPDAMSQTVYTATLTGPLSYQEGMSAVEHANIGSTVHSDRIVKDHMLAYPPPPPDQQPADGAVLQPLYPDRLGEDFLALTTPGHGSPFEPDPWATGAPARLLPAGRHGEPLPWAGHALTTLIETARRWRHVEVGQLYPLLREHPQLVLQASGAALTTLADLDSIDEDLLEAIEACLPEGRHVDLDTGIAAIMQQLADRRLTHVHDPAERAQIHRNLGIRLSNAGLRPQALRAFEHATNSAGIWQVPNRPHTSLTWPDP